MSCDALGAFLILCRASPRLKDAQLDVSICVDLYVELVLTVRKLFHQCKLVHADLSEYNILYHNSHLYIIDVSQSVEHDHPSAFDFLRKDIKNVEDFFQKVGVKCLGLRRCFEYVTKETLDRENEESDEGVLKRFLAESPASDDAEAEEESEQHQHEDSVFFGSYIPRTLNEVYDPERDLEKTRLGDEKPIYADTIGVVMPGKRETKLEEDEGLGGSETDGEDSDDSQEDSQEQDLAQIQVEKRPRGHRHEDKEAKKVRHSHLFSQTIQRLISS